RTRDDLPWRYAVARDELLCVIDGNLPRDIDGTRFAHSIRQVARAGHDALLRSEVDDAPPDLLARLLGDHLLYRALAAVEHARQIDAHDVLPLRGLGLEQRGAGVCRCVVHHDIKPAMAFNRRADQRVDVLPASYVGLVIRRR